MPAFLAQNRGRVVRVDSTAAGLGDVSPFAVRIRGLSSIGNRNNSDSRILITQVDRSEAGSFQLQHTFGKTIYAYIFGDRVGELKLSGICFSGGCDDRGSGIDTLHDAYESNRIAVREAPLIITYGNNALVGLLTGMAAGVSDPETQLMQWSFRFNTFRAVG